MSKLLTLISCLIGILFTPSSVLASMDRLVGQGGTLSQVFQVQNQPCDERYIVQSGDSLREIARRCGTTVSRLLFENPMIDHTDRIYPGQVIYLPHVARTVERPTQSAAQQAGQPSIPVTGDPSVTQPTAINAPAANAAAAGSEAASSLGIYRVKRGDSLGRIAAQLGTSTEVLMLANPQITNPNLIYANQELRVPNAAEIEALRAEQARQDEEVQRSIVQAVGIKNDRWIDVDLANQKVRAYQGQEVVNTFTVSTGTWRTPTVTGQYKIWIKLEADDMRGPGYYLEDVPYVMYFYKGYGLHGTYWHDNFGTPMSHGCVNLTVDDARWLFDFAEVGTLVNVH